MGRNLQFEQPNYYKLILRNSYREEVFYGLDDFDCRYLKIIQAKFGCQNSLHTIPDRVKMEMARYVWNDENGKYILDENTRQPVRINQLEFMVVNYDPTRYDMNDVNPDIIYY
ncbi:MAG: hypothetical protein MI922_09235 [Bacteroidales bacterium]|nr:hypothetical protein [Bacteroidales bacterium]